MCCGSGFAHTVQEECEDSLWQHVFSKDRLEVKQHCVFVTDKGVSKLRAPDGDYHIRIKVTGPIGVGAYARVDKDPPGKQDRAR